MNSSASAGGAILGKPLVYHRKKNKWEENKLNLRYFRFLLTQFRAVLWPPMFPKIPSSPQCERSCARRGGTKQKMYIHHTFHNWRPNFKIDYRFDFSSSALLVLRNGACLIDHACFFDSVYGVPLV